MMQSACYDGVSFEQQFGLNSPFFAQISRLIQQFLQEDTTIQCTYMRKWASFFGEIHRKEDISEELFVKHTYLFLLIKGVLRQHFFRLSTRTEKAEVDFLEINQVLKSARIKCEGFEFFEWAEKIPKIGNLYANKLKGAQFARGDLFYRIYQGMTSPAARHALGEFYTPPALTRLMIDHSYKFGTTTLDPACGSGTFIIEIIQKIRAENCSREDKDTAISHLFGFDINPLAILVSKANFMLQFDHSPQELPRINLYQVDPLFPNTQNDLQPEIVSKFDLIIGNPPWIVLNAIHSEEQKNRIKHLALELGIMRGGKYATHTELSALFFYRCRDLFLKDGGWIFFVVTAGFLSGDQHAKFRQFIGFGNAFAWRFDEDIFRVHNICLGLQKIQQSIPARWRVQVTDYHCQQNNDTLTFEQGALQAFLPYNSNTINSDQDLVRRLIPESEISQLLPSGSSSYAARFFQGASLVPRTLLFVIIQTEKDGKVTIVPDMRMQAKPPWDFSPYSLAQVEKKYLFPIAKSTELVPFKLVTTQIAFLPIDPSKFAGGRARGQEMARLEPLAQAHFERMSALYHERQKRGASITEWWKRLDYNHGLVTLRQAAPLKVVFRGIGGYTQAAIVGAQVIVDTSCYFCPVDSDGEAYYLLAILNSHTISRDLRRRGSTGASGSLRNLHKRPLDYNIPVFDPHNPAHQKLAQQGRHMEKCVEEIISDWQAGEYKRLQGGRTKSNSKIVVTGPSLELNQVPLRPHAIHNRIRAEIEGEFDTLDALVNSLLRDASR